MNINRHNYQTFFLLYVDKELSAADRRAVDVFVKENPDLQIELHLLQETVMSADDIVLDKKDWLYMEEDISALQENLLLYADDELNPVDKKAVETLLQSNKAAIAEWAFLGQTKLQPDTSLVFKDKQSLYRKEGGRVVGFAWRRNAAAAVLLGFVLWAGLSVYKNDNKTSAGSTEMGKGNITSPVPEQADTQATLATTTKVPTNQAATENNAVAIAKKTNESSNREKTKIVAEKADKQNTAALKETLVVQNSDTKKPDNNLPKPYSENFNNKQRNETASTNVKPENNNSNPVSGSNEAVVKTNTNEKTKNAVVPDLSKVNTTTNPNTVAAIQVVNNNTANESKNVRYLDVDDGKEKRTALGGFLRKAKRVLERTTNINTGEGIKIAGFEIALK